MEDQELLLRFFQVVAYDLKHEHYSHTTDKALLYNQLVAGVNLDKLLKQYVRREDSELFKQRVKLTQHIVTSVCENLLYVFYKVPRSSTAKRVIAYANDEANKAAEEVESILKKFWGNSSWDDYMATRFIELNALDPNSFVVFEWDSFDANKELIQPRPFEVSSSEAVDFKYRNQVLQYLIVKDPTYTFEKPNISGTPVKSSIKRPEDGKNKGLKFTLYGKNQTWTLAQVSDTRISTLIVNEAEPVNGTDDLGNAVQYVKLGSNFYEFKTFEPHGLDAVPAFRVGYKRDPKTKGKTYVNPLHAAEPFILKTVTANSHLDLVASLIAFPQQIKYGAKCEDDKCYKGHYDNGQECATCKGTGIKQTAPSVQDSIVIPMPASKEEMVPLNELIAYINPDVDIVKWQEEYIDKLTAKCKQFMFNSDIFSKAEVADTATGKNLDMQNVYDTLYPFASRHSKLWIFGTSTMAKLADRFKGLIVGYTYGKDFKFKSLDSLIFDLSQANALNNATLVSHINNDIADVIFADKPMELQRYKLQQFYNPFSGKNDKEIIILLASNYVGMREKILYANFGRIFDELELEWMEKKKNFYTLNRVDQTKAIRAKVDAIMAEIKAETPEPVLPLN